MRKTQRGGIAAALTALAIGLTALIAPPASASPAPAASASAEAPAYSDKEIVLGLVFGVGDFAAQIGTKAEVQPQKGQTKAAANKAYKAAAAKAAAELLSRYPELSTAVNEFRSGDPVAAEQAFTVVGKVLNDYSKQKASEQGAVQKTGASSKSSSKIACGVAVVCWAYAAAAVHNTVVVTGLVAVVIGGALWCGAWAWCGSGKSGSLSAESKLKREQLAVDVALAARQ